MKSKSKIRKTKSKKLEKLVVDQDHHIIVDKVRDHIILPHQEVLEVNIIYHNIN